MKPDLHNYHRVGYKGQLNLYYGGISAPYKPLMQTGYAAYLQVLNQKFNLWITGTFFIDKVDGLKEATEMMQQRYPGNYKLIERYNSTRGAVELDVKFDDPKEEMLWKMKWA